MKCEYKLIYEDSDNLIEFLKSAYANNILSKEECYLLIDEKNSNNLKFIDNLIVHLFNDEHIIGFLKGITVTKNGNFYFKPISIYFTINEYKYDFTI